MEINHELQSKQGFVKRKLILLIKHSVNTQEQCEGESTERSSARASFITSHRCCKIMDEEMKKNDGDE